MVVSRAFVRNCFLVVKHGILNEDSKNAIFLQPIIRVFSFDICVPNYSEIEYQIFKSRNQLFSWSLFDSNSKLKYSYTPT